MPGEQPAAAERRDHRIDVRQILEDFQRDRPVPADEVVVVERVNEAARHPIRAVLSRPSRQHSSYGALTIVAPRRSMAASLVCGAVSITSTWHGTPALRAASATPWPALPALTVQTPSARWLRRQPPDGVPGAADLEGADRLKRFELEIHLGAAGLGRQADERSADNGVVDDRGGITDRLDRNLSSGQPDDRSGLTDPVQSALAVRGNGRRVADPVDSRRCALMPQAQATGSPASYATGSGSATADLDSATRSVAMKETRPCHVTMNRREFVRTGTAAGLAAAAARTATAAQAPAVTRSRVKPLVIASDNGHQFKNGGAKTCVETAFAMITSGEDVLDALIAGVNIVELDPLDTSVGYGGLPNADGVVQLDSCCMHGPKKRAGGVGVPRRRPHAVAGRPEGDGLHRPSPARRQGRAGVRAQHRVHDRGRPQYRSVARRVARMEAAQPIRCTISIRSSARRRCARIDREMMAEGWVDPKHFYGTINCNGINAAGDICGVTTTSGLAWKIPGRRRRLADPRRRAVCRWRGRRGRLDRARRGQPVQPVLVS